MPDALDSLVFGDPHETGPAFVPPSMETMLTSPDWFGLETATPMQRAVCRLVDGVPLGSLEGECEAAAADIAERYAPDIAARSGLQWALAGNDDPSKPVDIPSTPTEPPDILVLLGAVRSGKTKLGAAALVRMALRVDVGLLTRGETPRASCLSIDKDKAAAMFDEHLVPAFERSHVMRPLLIGEPKSSATEKSIMVRHPSGMAVEIKVVAGARAGAATISRWSAGVLFSEAARMLGQDDAVVNLDEQEGAALGRLLPGATIIEESSPFAPMGPVFDHVQKSHGHPSRDCVVFRASGPALNPLWWTPERCEGMRRKNPDAFTTDVIGDFIAVLISLFGAGEVERMLRDPADLPPEPRCHYWAIMDPATRSNAWTLVVGALYPDGVRRIALARQWVPSGARLDPREVLGEIAEHAAAYRCPCVETDQWSADALQAIAYEFGLTLADTNLTRAMNVDAFDSLRHMVRVSPVLVQVPAVPCMADDLKRVQRKVSRDGGIKMHMPVTKDGRHCDYAGVVARFAVAPLPPPLPEPEAAPDGWTQEEYDEMRAAERAPDSDDEVIYDD